MRQSSLPLLYHLFNLRTECLGEPSLNCLLFLIVFNHVPVKFLLSPRCPCVYHQPRTLISYHQSVLLSSISESPNQIRVILETENIVNLLPVTTCPCGLPAPGLYISSAKCHDYGEHHVSKYSLPNLPTDFPRVSSCECKGKQVTLPTRRPTSGNTALPHRWTTR